MIAQQVPAGGVLLMLSREQALVLFDCLQRWEEEDIDINVLPYADPAEQRVLWDLSGALETVIDEAFLPEYGQLVDRAREVLRDETE